METRLKESAALLCTQAHSLDFSDLQAEVSRCRSRIFTILLIFSQFSSIIIGFFFISYSLVTVQHLESFEDNLFE